MAKPASLPTVRLQLRRRGIRLHYPDLSPMEVVQQRLQTLSRNLSCPNNFRMIDVRPVVNPLVVRNMVLAVADNNQMESRSSPQLPDKACALHVPGLHLRSLLCCG